MIPDGLEQEHIMLAIKEIDADGVPSTRVSLKYDLRIDEKNYPPKYVISIASKYHIGKEWPYTDFIAEEARRYFESRGYEIIDKSQDTLTAIEDERDWRQLLWEELGGADFESQVSPQRLRDLGIYGGQQGIWVDKNRTQSILNDKFGIAVSVIHKGDRYPDDFDETGVIYHYPNTDRPRSRDLGEVEAVKNCSRYNLPIFVIRVSLENSRSRDVFIGYVTYWDDESEVFIIEFGERVVGDIDQADEKNFQVKDDVETRIYVTRTQSRDAGFRIASLRRYGTKCAVCDINVVDLLDAAHIVPKSENGTNDVRNGIVLCCLHHRAYDRGLFAINPNSLEIVPIPKGPSLKMIGVIHKSIAHLKNLPHTDALEFAWQKKGYKKGN